MIIMVQQYEPKCGFLCFSTFLYTVEISHMLATYYGGWVEDNDCSDLSYVRFDKGSDTSKPIRHVTLEDVYKAFGEIVIIDY